MAKAQGFSSRNAYRASTMNMAISVSIRMKKQSSRNRPDVASIVAAPRRSRRLKRPGRALHSHLSIVSTMTQAGRKASMHSSGMLCFPAIRRQSITSHR